MRVKLPDDAPRRPPAKKEYFPRLLAVKSLTMPMNRTRNIHHQLNATALECPDSTVFAFQPHAVTCSNYDVL